MQSPSGRSTQPQQSMSNIFKPSRNLDEDWKVLSAQLLQDPEFFNAKTHDLPLSRIKKIIKNDEDVSMVSQEALSIYAKACELFILDLTMRGFAHTNCNRRRVIQRSDLAAAVLECDKFDFLIDIIPKDDPADLQ